MIALDTETTGLDPYHGSKPFLVTIAHEDGNVDYWEWDVDPRTRQPRVPRRDKLEIRKTVRNQKVIMHNAKFDMRMLSTIGIDNIKWSNVHETTLMAHLLNSVYSKKLSALCLYYLQIDLDKFDEESEKIVKKCRTQVNNEYPEWHIAKEKDPDIPSAKETVWKLDLWLPRALAKEEELPEDHEYWYSTSTYANADSEATLLLFREMEEIVKKRGLWKLYQQRRKLLPILYNMEETGITLNTERMEELEVEYKRESRKAGRICTKIAKSYDYELELPKGSVNNSLKNFCFKTMKLPVVKRSKKTGNPSLDSKDTLPYYINTLEGKPLKFVQNLANKRKRDTAVTYMAGYRRFMLPTKRKDVFVLHPSVNPTGTNTLRSSSSNPNEQNISKKEGFNLRYAFGPAPGREWWALDYNNLELRIPAYECEEPAMLELFERPNDPPYYGSYHLLIFSILYPEKFRKHGDKVKDIYKSTLYQWTKNGNFAELYGAVDTGDGKSTADRAFHYPGAQAIVAKKLKKKSALNQHWINFANKHGYVTTLPDKTVDPNQGYPLKCPRRKYGRISPTIPLNYHVQGSACWVKCQAMVKIHPTLPPGYHIVMDVHDEIVFDFPKHPRNKKLIKKVQKLMESCGDDIGIPLTCGVDYHPNNWSQTA